MEAKFSQRVKDVLSYSREEALRLGNNYIGLEHLLLGILREGEGLAVQLMKYLGMDLNEVRQMIEKAVANPEETVRNADNLPLVRQAERALKITYLEAKMFNSELIGTEHLLLSILRDDDNIITKFFEKSGIDYDMVREELKKMQNGQGHEEYIEPRSEAPGDPADEEAEEAGRPYGNATRKPSESKSKTPVLDNFGRDITKAAEEGRLDPIVGREKELERIAQILSRRKKNNPILSGNRESVNLL